MAVCKTCGKKYNKWTAPVSAREVCRECFESEFENEPEADPQEHASSYGNTPGEKTDVCREHFESELENKPEADSQEYASSYGSTSGEKTDASPKWTPPPAVVGFLPRSESKIVFVLVMVCYAWVASAFVRTLAAAFNAPGPPAGLFMLHGRPTARVWDLLLLAPIFESLILVGSIELFRWLRAPAWVQVAYAALVLGFLHSVSWQPWGFIVAPAFAIQAIAYLIWRTESWKVGFGIVACIHALLNLMPAISVIAYGMRHA